MSDAKTLEKHRAILNIEKMKVAKMDMEFRIIELETEIARKREVIAKQVQAIEAETEKMKKFDEPGELPAK